MRKCHIIYHTDADGYCSAALVNEYLKCTRVPEEDIEFHPINYGMPVPEGIDYGKDRVCMVDFSFQPDELMRKFILDLEGKLTLIDHHPTTVDFFDANRDLDSHWGGEVQTHRDGEKVAACELVQGYLFGDTERVFTDVVKLIGDWDTWRHEKLEGNDAVYLQHALRMRDIDPKNEVARNVFWPDLLLNGESLQTLLDEGAAIDLYVQQENRRTMKDSFEAMFGGYPAILVNRGGNSKLFDGFYDEDRHKLMVTYRQVQGDYWSISLYSTHEDIHCGELSKMLGMVGPKKSGGGHKGAGGFQTDWKQLQELIVR